MNLTKDYWEKEDYKIFINYLFSLKEERYKLFQEKIIPNKKIIGVRTDKLKIIAKNIYKGNYKDFLKFLENNYYEENILYGLILTNINDIDILSKYLNDYLLIIDNWASCDLTVSNLKIVKTYKEYFYSLILNNITSNYHYIRRFCYVLLLNYFNEEKYLEKIFELCNIENDNYYVNMSIAWLLSVCYIKHKEKTLKYLNNNKLNKFTYNKTIQKIIESNQVKKEEKELLKLLKK